MKAYGHSRRDKLECKYGCCTGKSGKAKNCRKVVDRANRKTARKSSLLETSHSPDDCSSLLNCQVPLGAS